MSDVENEIKTALDGNRSDVSGKFNDFTLAQQNERIESKGAIPKSSSTFVPVCQKSVTYIVMAVIINDKDEVLMMQEAKPHCIEKWYLPAGRVEPDENLIEAVKREVLEETGLIMEPKSLVVIECAGGTWIRFVMTGSIIGGTLKTLDQADEDSLQAQWVYKIEDLALRSNDIVPLIQKCKDYVKRINGPWHSNLLPVSNPLNKLYLRVVVCIMKKTTNKMYVLVSEDPSPHLPVCEIYTNRNLYTTLHEFMAEVFGSNVAVHKPHGVLAIEFGGQSGNDGLCLTILVSFKPCLEDVTIVGKYQWQEISTNLTDAILSKLPKNMTVSLNVHFKSK